MSLTKAVLHFAAPLPTIERFKRFLFIGPHPDDIEIGAGATAAKLADSGKSICFLICTDGRYGNSNIPGLSSEEVILLREQEAIHSASLLGVQDLRFLRLSDGGFYEQSELLRSIASVVGDFQPDVIFAPDPWVSSECHADHINIGKAASQIACFAPYAGIMSHYGAISAPVSALAYYMTAKANQFIATRGYVQKQMESIFSCHTSQFPVNSPDAKAVRLYLKLRAADFGLRSLKGQAEGFRVLGPMHMHCLPEAGN